MSPQNSWWDNLTLFQVLVIIVLVIIIGAELGSNVSMIGWTEGQAAMQHAYGVQVLGATANHLELVGTNPTFGSYRLLSFDRGKTWWRLSEDRSDLSKASPELVRFALTTHDITRPVLIGD